MKGLLAVLLMSCIACGQTKINIATQTSGILPASRLSSPNFMSGANIQITGQWPNLTISASTSGSGSTSAIAAPTAAQVAPTPNLASECPSTNSNHPFWWMQDENGNYRTLAAIDTFVDPVNGPANATMVFCHHIALNDTGLSPIVGKNAAFAVFHTYGIGSVLSNQDRAISIVGKNGTSDTQAHYGIEGLQSEVDFQGAPSINGSPDGEVSAGSFQLSDQHTNTVALPHFGVNAVRMTAFRNGNSTGNYSSCQVCLTAFRAEVVNSSTATFNSGFMVAGYFHVGNQSGTVINAAGAGVWIEPAGGRLSTNTGMRIGDFGTNPLDRNISSVGSMPSSGVNDFQGPLKVATWTPLSATDTCITGTITWDVNFVYVCTATNSWKRSALASW